MAKNVLKQSMCQLSIAQLEAYHSLVDSWANPAIIFANHHDFSQLESCVVRDAKLHEFASVIHVTHAVIKILNILGTNFL